MAKLAPALPLVDGGRTRFQPVYVDDVADAVMAALRTDASKGRIYELGGPRVYSFRALMEFLLQTIGRRRLLVPVPGCALWPQAFAAELLPKPPLTRDQLLMLKRDNVVPEGALGLADLGITPTSIEAIVPSYLSRYRRGGAFAQAAS